MSAGAFKRAFYETNVGNIAPIRVQPETIAATVGGLNASATGPKTPGFPGVSVSRSRRSRGIHPRLATVTFTGTPPTGYLAGQSYAIPILTPARWANIGEGDTGTYLGQPIEVVSVTDEAIK